MKQFCHTCWKPVKVDDDYDDTTMKAFCTPQCYWVEWLFCQNYSDSNVEMRAYFNGMEEGEG